MQKICFQFINYFLYFCIEAATCLQTLSRIIHLTLFMTLNTVFMMLLFKSRLLSTLSNPRQILIIFWESVIQDEKQCVYWFNPTFKQFNYSTQIKFIEFYLLKVWKFSESKQGCLLVFGFKSLFSNPSYLKRKHGKSFNPSAARTRFVDNWNFCK